METISTSASCSERGALENLQKLCDLHNAMSGTLRDADCPKCKNKGWIFHLRGMQEVAQECTCMPVRESVRRMKRSGLYDKLQTQTFRSFRADKPWQKNMLDAARQFAEKRDAPFFFVGGQQGSGKTHLCTAICASLLEQGFEVQYFIWETYVKELLQRAGIADRCEHDALLSPLYRAEVVYLDDFLRKETPSQAERGVAFDVINRRYTEGKITVVSSEHTILTLLKTDQAVASRIKEMCGEAYCLNIDADTEKNYRMRNARVI